MNVILCSRFKLILARFWSNFSYNFFESPSRPLPWTNHYWCLWEIMVVTRVWIEPTIPVLEKHVQSLWTGLPRNFVSILINIYTSTYIYVLIVWQASFPKALTLRRYKLNKKNSGLDVWRQSTQQHLPLKKWRRLSLCKAAEMRYHEVLSTVWQVSSK